MRQQLALLVALAALANGLVPSSNIFTPSWLVQRRSRHLPVHQSYQYYPQPPSLYPSYPTHSAYQAAPSYSSRGAYYIQPAAAYSPPVLAPVDLSPARSYYQHQQPLYAQYYPVGGNQFAKRIDSVKPAEEAFAPEQGSKAPCSLLSSTMPSEHYPVYVLPPKNFQPIIYQQQSPVNYMAPVPIVYPPSPAKKIKSGEEMWYEAEMGENRMKSAHSDGNDIEPELSRERKKIYLVPVTEQGAIGQFPVYEAFIREVKPSAVTASKDSRTKIELTTNPYNKVTPNTDAARRLKTKLPVGLTSFFLGGVRGVSGRHWNMPAEVVKNLEFMPNSSPMAPENKYLPEETYVKQVDNDQSAAPSAGDPEKEEQEAQNGGRPASRKIFENNNTIVDSALDLEAQESSAVPQQLPPQAMPTST